MQHHPEAVGDREVARGLACTIVGVLDDVGFSADDTDALLDALDQSTFLIGGTEPRLDPTSDGAVALRGLPTDAAVAAYERCLRQSVSDSERAAMIELVTRLEGVPALVLEAARTIRDGVCEPSDLVSRPAAELERRRLVALTDAQRRLLALLVDLAPAAVPVDLLERAAGADAADARQQAGASKASRDTSQPSGLSAQHLVPVLKWGSPCAGDGSR